MSLIPAQIDVYISQQIFRNLNSQ